MPNTSKYGEKILGKLGIVKELFEMYVKKKKFYMIPIITILLAMIGVTILSQSGLITLIYPI